MLTDDVNIIRNEHRIRPDGRADSVLIVCHTANPKLLESFQNRHTLAIVYHMAITSIKPENEDAMKMNPPGTLLMRGGEVAESLGISRALAYRWMQNGTLPTVRVSRAVRVPREALLDWIKRKTQADGVAA